MTRWDRRPVLSSRVGLTDESFVVVELEPEGGEATCLGMHLLTNGGVEPDEWPGGPTVDSDVSAPIARSGVRGAANGSRSSAIRRDPTAASADRRI